MHLSISRKEHREPAQPLIAIKEFAHYLDGIEKDLSRVSKKLHTKEIAQSAQFVATGVHEAQHYLEIVRKVIERTQRAVQKKTSEYARKTNTPPTSLGADDETKSRMLIETWKGVPIWQGKCESCYTDTRIVFDGTRYLCVDCLKKLKSR